ncbi:endolytic transglycosylase MltG [Obesumbacterium proteus]|uniref:endolytic transglycosylase MltG n=1 Tax=Obesumbacterium proteus TaxID=82983 RepID=UPI001034D64F|nr:endolytic transglycosylase MltG [Obesumbacterium proteus]TBL73658.1 endolytic transglycosylase MltG [Obesumbacterium proteus]
MKKKLFGLLVVCIVVLLVALFWSYQQVQKFARTPLAITQETLFKLPAGTGRVALEGLLVRDKLIAHPRYFPWLLQLEPELANFKAGTYRITPGMTVREFLELLKSGKEAQFTVRFIEGTRFQDWMQVLAASPNLKHALANKDESQIAKILGIPEGRPIEGWLYPDTYHYTAGNSDEMILKRAYNRMSKEVDEIWQDREKNLPYKTPEDLVTMASIIEKETGVGEERGKVASVFINRLRIGMRLQTDPTVIYGLGKNYNGNLTRRDLQQPTAYNTYVISGLPPTPIAMPSRASLEAAAHPEKTSYLYFVADGKGGHVFTTNLQSHNQAVRNYLQVLREKNEK